MTLWSDLTMNIEDKSKNLLDNIAIKVHTEENAAIANHKNTCLGMSKTISLSHKQLVKTNSIAIKNNKIIPTQLAATETKIDRLKEKVSL